MNKPKKMYERAFIVRGHKSAYCDFAIEEVCIVGAYDNGHEIVYELLNAMGDRYVATAQNLFASIDELKEALATRVVNL